MSQLLDNSEPTDCLKQRRCADSTLPGAAVLGDLVRRELGQILSSQTFHGAEAHKRFLHYVVDLTLAGNSQEVKEYTLGVHVFSRGSSFDPRLDPIVRVQARKLRTRLTKYYETEGEHDQLRIELPARGYIPSFRQVNPPASGQTSAMCATETSGAGTENGSLLAPGACPGDVEFPAPPMNIGSPLDQFISSGLLAGGLLIGNWRRAALACGLLMLASVTILASWVVLRDHTPPAPPVSVAVLPFQNLGDTKDESFSDGLTDELINLLGRVQGLQVVGRTSAFQYRSKTTDIREIGKKLNVRTVLEGGVRIYGNRLRITAELVDTTNGFSIWSGSYERNSEDALFIQRDISQAIVSTLEQKIAKAGAPAELKFSPAKASPVNVEAYRDHLRGLYFWNKQTTESIQTAKNYFEHAIALDPSYAPEYTGLARCYINLPLFTKARARDVIPKIRELALKAQELDNGLPEAHIDLAYASFLEYDWAGADSEFKKGLDLGPGDALAHRLYSNYLVNVGRMNEALAENRIAQQLDPVSPFMTSGTARSLYLMRRYEEAIEQYKKTLELDPRFIYAHLGLGTVYIQEGKYPEAIEELRLAQALSGSNLSSLSELARAYPPVGRTQEAQNILSGFLKQASTGSFPAKPIAKVYLALGDKDQALAWLGKAISAQDVSLELKSDPIWDPLRPDPRFQNLIQDAQVPLAR